MYFRISLITVLLLTQFGCSLFEARETEPTAVTKLEQPKSQAQAPLAEKPPQVAIIVSNNIPAYQEVADELKSRLDGRAQLYSLKGRPEMAGRVRAMVEGSGSEQVVAVGLGAALVARELQDRQVVFCQVFNYAEHNLLKPNHKGVSMLPGLGKTFAAWKAIAPNLADVGVISGPDVEATLELARTAAARQGVRLHHVTVESDKEFQYAYKALARKVQGYWLLPDNRVLSRGILRDVMTFSVRRGKQVLVFSEELLRLGGLLSASSNKQDIAEKVLDRLTQAVHREDVPGEDVVPLDEAELRINAVMAKRLNLLIPKQYSEYTGAPDRH